MTTKATIMWVIYASVLCALVLQNKKWQRIAEKVFVYALIALLLFEKGVIR